MIHIAINKYVEEDYSHKHKHKHKQESHDSSLVNKNIKLK